MTSVFGSAPWNAEFAGFGAGENILVVGVQLDVHLEADDRLEQLEGLVEVHQFSAGHQTAPSSVASSSWVRESGAWSRIGPPHSASSSCSSAPPTL